jgi:UDPglucose--hexose-1-phosphate uridylyltransferase
MPELRTDWLTGRTVLVAENRADRPNEFDPGEAASAAGRTRAPASCPFCPGNEANTPRTEYEKRDDKGHWRVRVTANKYPAVTLSSGAAATSAIGPPEFTCAPAIGAHEVIIECARHIDRTSALTVLELREVLETYAERLHRARRDHRFAYGLVFKNQGPAAGATIAHLHSQLIALPAIPPVIDAELGRAKAFHTEKRQCVYCRLAMMPRAFPNRMVSDCDGYIAFCPYASLQPYEVWLIPVNHEASFERAAESDGFERLARVLHPLIARIESVAPNASFNMLLRTAPWRPECDPWYHWRIELLPRFNTIAGLEIATGIFVNPVPPERAASRLRPM